MAAPKNTLTNFSDPKAREAFFDMLSQLTASTFTADTGIVYHTEPPTKISLPIGMSAAKGSKMLAEVAAALDEPKEFVAKFNFRPWDGAVALLRTFQQFFGTSGRGISIPGMFGSTPPKLVEVEIGVDQTVTVPWGRIAFEMFEGWIQTGSTMDERYGELFQLTVYAPKKYEAEIHSFFRLVEMMLKDHSIYKGKAIYGVSNPHFLKLVEDPTIVYNDDVYEALWTCVWGVLKHRTLLKKDKRKVSKRILIEGPFGTGKSMAGVTTAKVATEEGITFIQFASGGGSLDDLRLAVQTAALYAPAVVFVEDVDVYAKKRGDGMEAEAAQSRLLEIFDGLGSKADDVMIVMTSNHAPELSRGMLRAGRVDRIIHVGMLDKVAIEKLIRKVIGEKRLSEDLDFEAIHEAMKGYEPSFVRTTFDQAAEAAILRRARELAAEGWTGEAILSEALKYTLTTTDLVTAAKLLRPQHDLHTSPKEPTLTTMDSLVGDVVRETMKTALTATVELNGGDYEGTVTFADKVL